eukprot:scaffold231223_cov24-Tisochrysis_lutea.AAC.1
MAACGHVRCAKHLDGFINTTLASDARATFSAQRASIFPYDESQYRYCHVLPLATRTSYPAWRRHA